MPLQAQLTLLAIYLMSKYSNENFITSGDIYDIHLELTKKLTGVKELTKRRISDYINELTLAGIITANTRSMGHYGRTKIITLDVDIKLIERTLSQIKRFKMSDILNHKPIILQNNKVKVRNNVFKKLL
ncbi:MAG: hypothetical protein EU533_03805 [Promethearchaeota archaeon]|nr:MAG: hypothetical protein EU533_03805 [Candidatus Lokiarchaeota archaeon]